VSATEVANTNADLVTVLVAGEWPLDALSKRRVTVFDAVNAGGKPDANRERL